MSPAPQATSPARLVEQLVADLGASLDGSASRGELVASVERAIRDLTGSVTSEALPEMAARLVAVRLTGGDGPLRVRTGRATPVPRRARLPRLSGRS